jgi:carboxypeptidase PM20D1
MKRALQIVLLALAALAAVLLVRAWRATPVVVEVERIAPALDADAMAARLSAAVRIPTVSATADSATLPPFFALHALLETQFPRVHAALGREVVNGGALLLRWPGREACPAIVLAAHLDVVPVEPGTESGWTHPPFSGAIADGAVWGRGALDDKAGALAILEAVEHLLAADHVPRCPVWLAFGHDEEIGGKQGATALAARLRERGEAIAFVLDEGGALTRGTVKGVDIPVATIGVAEKGYVSVRLRTRADGGHSSMPPRETAIGRLARAVSRVETQRPDAAFGEVQRELLRRIAPHVPFGQRVALSNLWLTAPLVESMLASAPAADATLRTTTAPTMFNAGVKDNVLPQHAEAVINFRIRPGDSVQGVLEHVRSVVDDDLVEIAATDTFASEPTPTADWNGEAFLAIERALRSASPEAQIVVAPFVTNGATDARHYAGLTPNLFRLLPVLVTPDLLGTVHGTNERLPIAEYLRAVRFHIALLQAR